MSVALPEVGEQTQRTTTRLTPRALKYAQFQVEIAADGFPLELGAGAMAVTYRAYDTILNSPVALKVIDRGVAEDPGVRSRFLREARAAAQIRHPNVAHVIHYGEQDGECYYVMELVDGETLEARVRRDGPLPLDLALEIIEQAARALVAAEACGVVHRDIKPSNIMLESDASGAPIVKVIDYGVAKVLAAQDGVSAEQTQTGFIGTPAFASPEQFVTLEQARIDTRSDVYSLGLTFWYLLSGRTPFQGRTLQEIREQQTEDLPWEQLKGRHIPAQCLALLKSMLASNPKDRPQTARDLLSAIHRCHAKFSAEGRSVRRLRLALTGIGVALVLAIALGTWSYRQMRSSTSALPPIDEKSIAVLPFANLSSDKENAYFADGIQNEILTRLSKIADLKVISQTSTERYKSAPENLSEIAKQLGVAHIVEGSVQKSGDAVRVNVQLIKAANDSHLWADSFDRKLTDIFSVESEIAKIIADQLQAKLTVQEQKIIAAKPTDNPDAYDAYLRGLAYDLKASVPTNIRSAQRYLQEAVRLDPKFALAWALLSSVESRGYRAGLPQTLALREDALRSAETALALQPRLGEAVLAMGLYHYACLKDYDIAVSYFEQARQFLPNSSRIPESLALVARRRGDWDRSESYFIEAEGVDPRNVRILSQHVLSYIGLRRFPEAVRMLDQILNVTPDDANAIDAKAAIAQAQGDLPRAAQLLATLPEGTEEILITRLYQTILERRPGPVIPQVKQLLEKSGPGLSFSKGNRRFWLGCAQDAIGDHAAAQESWMRARSELEPLLKEQPENGNIIALLALTEVKLGEKASALALAERAMAQNPLDKDALGGPGDIELFARVAAQAEQPDRAISALEKLMSIPACSGAATDVPPTPAILKLDPMFDSLRSDPRFQKLLTSPSTTPLINEKSIAVLPFENRSEYKENEYFADGVQDEILTDLAKIADLRVISRSSVMQYKGGVARNLRKIGEELGVAHVVEGSVQRAANKIRVNAQLIDTRTDAHLWAQTYDRDLADVFAIQSEIAKAIADQLQARLSPNEKAAIEKPPTADLAAFDLYTRAKTLLLSLGFNLNREQVVQQAIELLNQAVARDPTFSEAYYQLVYAHGYAYSVIGDHTPARLALAEAALQAASRLRPEAGETHRARATYLYSCLRDYNGALAELEVARRTLPNDPRIFELTGYILRRRGRMEEGVRNLERSVEFDPRNSFTLKELALTYQFLRRYAEEVAVLDRALTIVPNDVGTRTQRALVEFNWKAQTRPLHETIDSILAAGPGAISNAADAWFQCALAERDPTAVERALVALGDNPCWGDGSLFLSRSFGEGLLARILKDEAGGQAAFTKARLEQEKIVQARPDYGPPLCVLGLIDAALGRKEEALREGRRAIELLPVEKDSTAGSQMLVYFAMIAAWAGEKDTALQYLADNAQSSGGFQVTTYGALKLLPFWDPLRGDPRFEKILASLVPKEASKYTPGGSEKILY